MRRPFALGFCRHPWCNMRNISAQYSQPENRVTPALMTALNEDRPLLDGFLDEFLKDSARHIPPKSNGPAGYHRQSCPAGPCPNSAALGVL